ncbi:MAG: LicD family protein [Oscillospiraceae bacterium]|nr:LicD family protein [Oscillospiraceae bacterium]
MLRLVLEIDEICRKHDIEYFLTGGSVLGAVRHKGYIPWDDDIDIMMTRQAFRDFEKACQTDMPEDREIISMMNTPCHTKVTIKFMNKTTSQFFRSQVLDTTGCGISLDIFILDPLPLDEQAKEQHIAEYIVFNELLTPFFMVNPYLYKHVDLYKSLFDEAKRVGKQKVMDRLYQRLFVDEPEQSDRYLYRWGQQLLIYEKRLLGKPRYMEFEGHMLPVPEKTLDFLRATYGDSWIYLPAEAQREMHVSNYSPTIAYCNWLKDIDPFLNRPKVLKDFVRRKKHNVEKAVPAHLVDLNNYKLYAAMKQLEFASAPAYDYDTLAGMDDRTLLKQVKDYLSHQLSGGFVKKQVFIQIPDEKLALILNAMIRVGDYPKADKLLKLRQAEGPLKEALQQVRQRIDDVRKTVSYFEDRRLNPEEVADIETAGAETLRLLQENPRQINLHRCVLELYTLLPGASQEEILKAINAALEIAPEDPEMAFWAGCLYQKLGRPEAAQLFVAAKATSNGVILLRLKEMNLSNQTEGTEND